MSSETEHDKEQEHQIESVAAGIKYNLAQGKNEFELPESDIVNPVTLDLLKKHLPGIQVEMINREIPHITKGEWEQAVAPSTIGPEPHVGSVRKGEHEPMKANFFIFKKSK